jgi:tripartite-type tricarboxylate transporter receptor subunit TctC
VIIENVGGAGGSIGVGPLARASPDGYTIDLGQWDTHVGNIVYSLTYDLQKDFEPIGLVSINPQLMVARKNFPANDLKELIAWMKAHPGEVKLSNVTAASQVSGLLLQQFTGTRLQFIPYRGAGPAMTDLISGQVLDLGSPRLPLRCRRCAANKKGDRKPCRATLPNPTRHPDIRRNRRTGLHCPGWFGLFARQGTPRDIITKLNAAMVQALADPVVRSRFAELGLDIAALAACLTGGRASRMDKRAR